MAYRLYLHSILSVQSFLPSDLVLDRNLDVRNSVDFVQFLRFRRSVLLLASAVERTVLDF